MFEIIGEMHIIDTAAQKLSQFGVTAETGDNFGAYRLPYPYPATLPGFVEKFTRQT